MMINRHVSASILLIAASCTHASYPYVYSDDQSAYKGVSAHEIPITQVSQTRYNQLIQAARRLYLGNGIENTATAVNSPRRLTFRNALLPVPEPISGAYGPDRAHVENTTTAVNSPRRLTFQKLSLPVPEPISGAYGPDRVHYELPNPCNVLCDELLAAIRKADRRKFITILEHDPAQFYALYAGLTLLNITIVEGRLRAMPIIKYLVEQRHVNIKQRDEHGSNGLEAAVFASELDILKYFLSRFGVPAVRSTQNGRTLVHLAAQDTSLDCLQYLVEERQMPVDREGIDGALPLHYAAHAGNLTGMLYLIAQLEAQGKSDLLHKQRGQLRYTPLHCLAASQKIESDPEKFKHVVQKLAKSKAIGDCQGRTPQDLALNRPDIDPDLLG
ncbi:MAG: ankyrin repeat domain-containing protein [Bacteroidota bacterium]